MLLKVQGMAKAALGVVAQFGMAGAPPEGAPLNGSQTTALLKYWAGLPVPLTCWSKSGRTVKEMPGPGPMASVGLSGLPVCACWVTPNCQPETSRLDLKGSSAAIDAMVQCQAAQWKAARDPFAR